MPICIGAALRTRWITAILLSILFYGSAIPAFGQAEQCTRNSRAETYLVSVKAQEDKARGAAASALINDWRTALPTIMEEFRAVKGASDRWPPDQQSYLLSITDIIRTILSANAEAITLFRACDDGFIIKPIIWAARGQNPSLRLNATLILGNTVDNTTICYLLHHLRDPNISSNGRANLLGATVAVASYAYKENVLSIEKTLELVRPKVDQNLAQTQKTLTEITGRAQASPNRNKSLADVGLQRPCADYNYDAQLD